MGTRDLLLCRHREEGQASLRRPSGLPSHAIPRLPTIRSLRLRRGGLFAVAFLVLLPSPVLALKRDPVIAEQQRALASAKRSAETAERRAAMLERQARAARRAAERTSAERAAAAAAIQAAEARIAAGEAQAAIIDRLRARQHIRLAEQQGPIVRLAAALQIMARRPSALALVQPGSVEDLVHVRALLGSALPEIRARTAGLRAEVARGDALRRQADRALEELRRERRRLEIGRAALARIEADQRRRSQGLVDDAMAEQDRMIAMGEKARDIAQLIDDLGDQADIRNRLASLPGPLQRPLVPGRTPPPPPEMVRLAMDARRPPPYRLPVFGRIVTGMGEISEAGVRAKGITLAAEPAAIVVSPAQGRIAYAGPFRSYAGIVIIDHGNGWSSLVTGLDRLAARVGQEVIQGSPIGLVAARSRQVTVELRHRGQAVDIMPILSDE